MHFSNCITKLLRTQTSLQWRNLHKSFSGSVKISSNNENLVIQYGISEEQFPLIWLRDNCQCQKCFHQNSQSRVINWNEFITEVKVNSLNASSDKVEIEWGDEHKSTFSNSWLKERSFRSENQEKYLNQVYKLPKVLWGRKDFNSILNRYSYSDILKSDRIFYYWLKDLTIKGVVLLDNAPLDESECSKLSNKVAFRRKTHYGEDFHVVSKPDTSNVAYLSGISLQLHTDLPYYHYKPGVILLHCLEQTKSAGGESLLVDVFHVAEKLRNDNKRAFDILSQVEVNWSDVGEEDGVKYHKIHRSPVISLDSQGNIDIIRYSTPQRDSHFTVNLESVTPWYKSLRTFVNMILEHKVQLKLKPGQILAFDNTRLAHGRVKYKDTNQGRRHLVGNYLDWDEIYSTMRVLKKELKL